MTVGLIPMLLDKKVELKLFDLGVLERFIVNIAGLAFKICRNQRFVNQKLGKKISVIGLAC